MCEHLVVSVFFCIVSCIFLTNNDVNFSMAICIYILMGCVLKYFAISSLLNLISQHLVFTEYIIIE